MNFSGFSSTKEIHSLVALGASLDRINVSLGPEAWGKHWFCRGILPMLWGNDFLVKENPEKFIGILPTFYLSLTFSNRSLVDLLSGPSCTGDWSINWASQGITAFIMWYGNKRSTCWAWDLFTDFAQRWPWCRQYVFLFFLSVQYFFLCFLILFTFIL